MRISDWSSDVCSSDLSIVVETAPIGAVSVYGPSAEAATVPSALPGHVSSAAKFCGCRHIACRRPRIAASSDHPRLQTRHTLQSIAPIIATHRLPPGEAPPPPHPPVLPPRPPPPSPPLSPLPCPPIIPP